MKEVTSVIYAEITVIAKVNDDDILKNKKEVAAALKDRLKADKVDVKKIKHFELVEKETINEY